MTVPPGNRAAVAILGALALAASGSAVRAEAAWPPASAGPDSRTVRERLDQRHKSHAVWTHDALKLRPDQEAGWRAMLAVLAPDHSPSDDRDVLIGRFYASLDPAQQRTFDQLVNWAKPRAPPPAPKAAAPRSRRTSTRPGRWPANRPA